MLDQCPPEEPPSTAIAFLTSDDCDRDVKLQTLTSSSQAPGWEYTIYAPSVQEAEQRAAALLHLIDCGVSGPMHAISWARRTSGWSERDAIRGSR